jgi:hypothetical protein
VVADEDSDPSEDSMDDYFDLGINFTEIASDIRHNRGSTTDKPFAPPKDPPNPWRIGHAEPFFPQADILRERTLQRSDDGRNRGGGERSRDSPRGQRGNLKANGPTFLSEDNAERYAYPPPRGDIKTTNHPQASAPQG